MPLSPGSSRKTISENIREMRHAGHPEAQSVAAALNEARKTRAEGGRADNFKQWFGKSKVVNDDGTPLRVFKAMHPYDDAGKEITSINRPSEFPSFHHGEPGYRIAGFFTHDPSVAEHFSEVYGGEHREGRAPIYPVHLKMENPYIVDAKGEKAGNMQFGVSGAPFRAAMRDPQYDGGIIRNTADEGHLFIPKSPTQVKSAIGNNGSYDPLNPDITKAKGGRLPRAEGGNTPQQVRSVQSYHQHAPHAHMKLHIGPIHSAVAGRTDHLPTHVPSGSYVLPAHHVSGLGESNTLAGFKVIQHMFGELKRHYGGLPYSGESAPYGQSGGPYGAELGHSKGGEIHDGDGVPCVLAGGEYVLSPAEVRAAGEGDMDMGHKALDAWVEAQKAKTAKTVANLPKPRRD